MMAKPKLNPIPHWRRSLRPRFSLRMLFVVMTLACYGAYKVEQARRQEFAAMRISSVQKDRMGFGLSPLHRPIYAHAIYDYIPDKDPISVYDTLSHELTLSEKFFVKLLEKVFG